MPARQKRAVANCVHWKDSPRELVARSRCRGGEARAASPFKGGQPSRGRKGSVCSIEREKMGKERPRTRRQAKRRVGAAAQCAVHTTAIDIH